MEWRFGVALWFGGVLTVFPSIGVSEELRVVKIFKFQKIQ